MIPSGAAPFDFTVGVCTTGPSEGIVELVASVLAESDAHGPTLRKVVVVASECPETVTSELRKLQVSDGRVLILAEAVRSGKADAVNKVLVRAGGSFVVMVNGDAVPEPGAMHRLLSAIASDPNIGTISARPVIQARKGLLSLLVNMIWSTHNESSRLLNHMNLSNHASEELVVLRRSAIGMLPFGLVNDGAFLALAARRRGYSVRFSESAMVHIKTPARVSDLIAQRRRILFGHAQAWRKAGSPPKTIESLLLLSPSIGLGLVVHILARNPRFLLIVPVAFVTEVSAALLSIQDCIFSTKRHAIWRRVT